MMEGMTNDWRKVADWVVRRRADLGLTQVELAQKAGISLDRIQSIEAVRRQGGYRGTTIAALEKALGWDYGSVESILAGGNPGTSIPLGPAEEITEARSVRAAPRRPEPPQRGTGIPRPGPRRRTTASGAGDEDAWRRQLIAEARELIREALAGEPDDVDDVDEFRLEERIARIRRRLDKVNDLESAAEIALLLRLYEYEDERRDAG